MTKGHSFIPEFDKDQVRADHKENKEAKIARLGELHRRHMEELYGVLVSKNNLSAKPVPQEILQMQIQGIVASSDLSALVDCLEQMGKIDRVDFTAQCVRRMERSLKAFKGPF